MMEQIKYAVHCLIILAFHPCFQELTVGMIDVTQALIMKTAECSISNMVREQ